MTPRFQFMGAIDKYGKSRSANKVTTTAWTKTRIHHAMQIVKSERMRKCLEESIVTAQQTAVNTIQSKIILT